MSRLPRSGWKGAIAALLLLAGAAGPGWAQGDSEQKAKEARLKELRGQISRLKGDLQRTRGKYDSLLTELRAAEEHIGRLAASLAELDRKIDAQLRSLDELQGRQQRLSGQAAAERRHLAGQVKAAYAMGRQEYLKIMLNQEDPAAVGRVLTYYDYLNRTRSERITAILETLRELERLQQSIDVETEQLRFARDRQASEKEQLEASRRERSNLLARLKKEIAGKDQRLKQMLTDERALAELVEALAAALQDIPEHPQGQKPFAQLRGALPWPAHGPLLAGFGEPRNVGDIRWQGVLIGAAGGSDVRAVSHGRVAFADWLRGYGLLLILDHGDGYMSLYGHNQTLFKELGDWVAPGEVVARVGDTGGQERSALYFEIRHDGKPANPARWCRR